MEQSVTKETTNLLWYCLYTRLVEQYVRYYSTVPTLVRERGLTGFYHNCLSEIESLRQNSSRGENLDKVNITISSTYLTTEGKA